jgi:RNA polymerase sigma-70 factor (ECF subfamily)
MIQPNSDHGSVWASATESLGATENSAAPARQLTPERAELTAIVVRAQQGDMRAQSDLVQRYRRRITGHIRGIIRNADEAEDLSQVVFIKMIGRLNRLRDASLFESWLFTLSRNTSLDHLRAHRRRPQMVSADEELFTLADKPGRQVERELLDELDVALGSLGPTDRTLVQLYVNGHSYRTMATREGLTPAAVKARLHRVRPFLRECMSGAGSELRDPRWAAAASVARPAA